MGQTKQKRDMVEELHDALAEKYSVHAIVVAAAEMLIEWHKSGECKCGTTDVDVADAKLALQSVVATAPRDAKAPNQQVPAAAIWMIVELRRMGVL